MLIGEKIKEKKFCGANTKDAYLKACKWISSNIIAVNNSEHITYKIEKMKDGYDISVRVIIYAVIDEEEVYERHCNICKEMQGAFFLKQNKYMCESCNLVPYKRRVKERLELIKETLKGKMLW